MSRDEAVERIRKVLALTGDGDLGPSESFVLRFDSLERAQLILELECEFDLFIEDEELPLVGCIDETAKYVMERGR